MTTTRTMLGGGLVLAGTILAAALLLVSDRDDRKTGLSSAQSTSTPQARAKAALDPASARGDKRSDTLTPSRLGLGATRGSIDAPSGSSTATAIGSGKGVVTDSAKADAAPGAGGTDASGALAGTSKGADTRALTPDQKQRLDEILGKVDWNRGLGAMVAAVKAARESGTAVGAEANVEMAQMGLALTQAAQVLGLKNPQEALRDPNVRSALVTPWLGSLGVNVSSDQSSALSQACLSLPPAGVAGGTFLDNRLAGIQAKVALEQTMGTILSPDQMDTYAANAPNDRLFTPRPATQQVFVSSEGTQAGLVNKVTSYWTTSFGLDTGSQQAAQAVASQYVAATLAVPPVAPNLGPEGTRLAYLDRNKQLVILQQQAEQQLASIPTLTQAQQTLVSKGSNQFLQLSLNPSGNGR